MKPYSITIKLIGLPKGMNGSHGHWRAAAAMRKAWKEKTMWSAVAAGKPPAPLTKCRVECVRHSSAPMDFDNLVASFKGCIDGLTAAGIISDDSQSVIVDRKYRSEYAKRGTGFVTITVESILTSGKASPLSEDKKNIAEVQK